MNAEWESDCSNPFLEVAGGTQQQKLWNSVGGSGSHDMVHQWTLREFISFAVWVGDFWPLVIAVLLHHGSCHCLELASKGLPKSRRQQKRLFATQWHQDVGKLPGASPCQMLLETSLAPIARYHEIPSSSAQSVRFWECWECKHLEQSTTNGKRLLISDIYRWGKQDEATITSNFRSSNTAAVHSISSSVEYCGQEIAVSQQRAVGERPVGCCVTWLHRAVRRDHQDWRWNDNWMQDSSC